MWTKRDLQAQLVCPLQLHGKLIPACHLVASWHCCYQHFPASQLAIESQPQRIKAANAAVPWLLLGWGAFCLSGWNHWWGGSPHCHFSCQDIPCWQTVKGKSLMIWNPFLWRELGQGHHASQPCVSYAARPLAEVLNSQGWPLCSWEVGGGRRTSQSLSDAQGHWEHGHDSTIQNLLPTKCLNILEGSISALESEETRKGNTFCRSPRKRKSSSQGTCLRCEKSHKHGYRTGASLHP